MEEKEKEEKIRNLSGQLGRLSQVKEIMDSDEWKVIREQKNLALRDVDRISNIPTANKSNDEIAREVIGRQRALNFLDAFFDLNDVENSKKLIIEQLDYFSDSHRGE